MPFSSLIETRTLSSRQVPSGWTVASVTHPFAEAGAFESAHGSAAAVDYPFDDVTAAVVAESDAAPPTSADGWVTLATVQPDGTCREDNVLVAIKDGAGMTLHLRIRGVTCRTYVVPNPATNANRGAQ